jgi:two-component system sensor histidine kinase FlrB
MSCGLAELPQPDAACLAATPASEEEQFLLRAFRSFAAAATSLESSYGQLRAEVARLNRELEKSNAGLAQSLEENRAMRQHLDGILESLPCGVLVAERDGRISRVNPEGRRLLGWDQAWDATIPQSLESLRDDLCQLLEHARAGNENEQEQSLVDASGRTRFLAVRHAVVSDASESSSVYILRDVSERKRLEDAQARLRREQALAEMSAVLAHEIRNPLGSLELFAGLLAEAELTTECRQWIEHVQAGLRTLAATVNNVLHFHSLPQPERAPLDLGQLLDWARNFFAPLARRARVEIHLRNRLAGVVFAADRHRLEQVLANLVLNALRAMPGGGWIQLAGRQIENTAEIVVADTGPGIAPENLDHIFEPGFTTRAGSPGLGLAVCRRIVEQHGGAIAAASRAGAKFTLTFPLASTPADQEGAR